LLSANKVIDKFKACCIICISNIFLLNKQTYNFIIIREKLHIEHFFKK